MFRLGKKIFPKRPPPPPSQVKGKTFDTRFGLIHVQTREKKFCQGTPPPGNSKKLLWPRGGRYASCVHAGGLSCWILRLIPKLANLDPNVEAKNIKLLFWFPDIKRNNNRKL